MADDDTPAGGEEWVDPGEAPEPDAPPAPVSDEDTPEEPVEEDSFETLGGVAQDGGDISAPDITGGTITGAKFVSESEGSTMVMSSGTLLSSSTEFEGSKASQHFGRGMISATVDRVSQGGTVDYASAELLARNAAMEEDVFLPEAYLSLETRYLYGRVSTGQNCLTIDCIASGAMQSSRVTLWGDGGVRIGNDHGFIHITPEGAIRVERNGQRVNLI